MTMRITIEGIKKVSGDPAIWAAIVPPRDIRSLGEGLASEGATSILLLTAPPVEDQQPKSITFHPSTVRVLNIGASSKVVFVVDQNAATAGDGIVTTDQDGLGAMAAGDQKFLGGLPQSLRETGSALLGEIRTLFPGSLKYHPKSGKYVESPDNFWTVKIQPRDGSLRVTIRGRPENFPRRDSIELKSDMSGYSAFKISRPTQVPDAVDIVRAAGTWHNR